MLIIVTSVIIWQEILHNKNDQLDRKDHRLPYNRCDPISRSQHITNATVLAWDQSRDQRPAEIVTFYGLLPYDPHQGDILPCY